MTNVCLFSVRFVMEHWEPHLCPAAQLVMLTCLYAVEEQALHHRHKVVVPALDCLICVAVALTNVLMLWLQAPHFEVIGSRAVHYGPFQGGNSAAGQGILSKQEASKGSGSSCCS
jgi:hypothetical protein